MGVHFHKPLNSCCFLAKAWGLVLIMSCWVWTWAETAVMKVIRSHHVHINELQSLLMEPRWWISTLLNHSEESWGLAVTAHLVKFTPRLLLFISATFTLHYWARTQATADQCGFWVCNATLPTRPCPHSSHSPNQSCCSSIKNKIN